jgi:hypothetical protein
MAKEDWFANDDDNDDEDDDDDNIMLKMTCNL